jgi:hypothetical protein
MAIKINGNTVIADNQAFTTTSTISATGNITGGNLSVIGTITAAGINTGSSPISTSGNVTGGNILTGGVVSATGNITGGNVSATNLTGTLLTAAQTNITSVGTLTSLNSGVISSSGNVTGANLLTAGLISSTGNITGGNVSGTRGAFTNVAGTLETAAQTNITSVGTLSSVSVTGNVQGGNIRTAGQISATGNITGSNLTLNGNAVITGNLSVSGTETIFNVANLTVNDKDIIVANNVTGSANVDGAGIQAGNPGVATWFYNNATLSWQSNVGITPTANGTLSLGGASNFWGNAFLTTASVTGNITGGNIRTNGSLSVDGFPFIGNTTNITGGNVSATNLTGSLTTAAQANITSVGTLTSLNSGAISSSGNVTGANLLTAGLISATGAITGAAITGTSLTVSTGNVTAGNIVNANANGVGNIGSSTTYFNTVFAKATSAQYADLAEKYTADAEYAPGTVVVFGGSAEVTVDAVDADRRVAGVVSTNPSYIMNAGCEGTNVATVALTGRVPCFVVGPVRKGDLMVAAGLGRARAEADPRVGTVIGKALEDHDGESGTIEVVVGRF